MDSCTGCGEPLYAGAEWCLQCLTPAGAPAPPAAAPAAQPVPAPAAVGAPLLGGAPAAPPHWAPPHWAPPPAPAPAPAPWAAPQAPAAAPPVPPPAAPAVDPWARAKAEGWSTTSGSFRDTPVEGLGPFVPPVSSIAPGAGVGLTVTGILGLGLLVQLVMVAISATGGGEVSDLVRKATWLIVAYYGVVLYWVVQKGKAVGFDPTWSTGPKHEGVVFGGVAGLVVCTAVVMWAKAAQGEIILDTGILMELGDLTPMSVALTLLITVVAAPLVEELLFRGLILEAFRHKGLRRAIVTSSVLFALWHWNGNLLYYTVMGIVLAAVFWKWGLFASMACHFAFNGTLVLLTIVFLVGPGEVVAGQGVRFEVPGGWRDANAATMAGIQGEEPEAIVAAVGPGGAQLYVLKIHAPIPGDWNADFLLMFVNETAQDSANGHIKRESLRPVEFPAGRAAWVEVEMQGQEGWMVVFPKGADLYYFVFLTAGSDRAKGDFEDLLQTVELP